MKDPFTKPTCSAYIWTRVLDTPFWALFNLLPFILYKDLHATPFQLAMIVTLKPVVSLLSSYWSLGAHYLPGGLPSSIKLARWIAYLPFFAFPFVHSAWYVIACFGLFMLLQVGMMPAWMELLKQNATQNVREKVFSYAQAFGYIGGGLLPFALGWVLEEWTGSWRWMFIIAAILALCAQFWQRRILVKSIAAKVVESGNHPLIRPWKNSWDLLKRRPDFAKFQIGFMLFGSGLMILQPALPLFFIDRLHLSYVEIGTSIALCKGISFACSTPFWVRYVQRVNIFRFSAAIALLAAVFPLLLLGAQAHISWLFIAYLLYGLMQAGSELSWNLSGPMFAKEEESSVYSSVNVITVGIRGLFVPSLGALLLDQSGILPTIGVSIIICLSAALFMDFYNRKTLLARSAFT